MAKPKQNNPVRKPSALLFYPVGFFAKFYYKFVFKHSVDKKAIRGLKPPYLVVANHSCWLDYMITGLSMYPVRMNYVAAYNFFRDKLLSKVLTGWEQFPNSSSPMIFVL